MYEACTVCGEQTNEHSHASCYRCGRTFHLALRQDIPAKDCGQVWLDDEMMALDFACFRCLEEAAGEGTPQSTQTAASPSPVQARVDVQRRYARREGTRASQVARGRTAKRR